MHRPIPISQCGTGWNKTFHAADGTPLVNLNTFPNIAQLPIKAKSLGLKADFYMNK